MRTPAVPFGHHEISPQALISEHLEDEIRLDCRFTSESLYQFNTYTAPLVRTRRSCSKPI